MSNSLPLKFKLNGKETEVLVGAQETLLDVLRKKLLLTGVKKGCGEGECGSCAVLLNGKPVNSCLVPAAKAAESTVVTIEGLGDNRELDVIQQAFIEAGAVQCGFCSPGVILSAKALLDKNPLPSDEEIKTELSGHLCRCTGYMQFLDAVKLAASRLNGEGKE